jgi:uncharacterized paraquat-inducible protein A
MVMNSRWAQTRNRLRQIRCDLRSWLAEPWEFLQWLGDELNHWPCRQCGISVRTFEEMCPRCGTYGPVRLMRSPAIVVAILVLAAVAFIYVATR